MSVEAIALLCEIAALLPLAYCATKAFGDLRARRYDVGACGVVAALVVAALEAGLIMFFGALSLK